MAPGSTKTRERLGKGVKGGWEGGLAWHGSLELQFPDMFWYNPDFWNDIFSSLYYIHSPSHPTEGKSQQARVTSALREQP